MMAGVFYLHFGLNTYASNRKAAINRWFLVFCILLSIWSLSYSFVYMTSDAFMCAFWVKISAVGWCFFPPILLVYVLELTGHGALLRGPAYLFLFAPAALLYLLEMLFFYPGAPTPAWADFLFNWGGFAFYLLYFALSLAVLWKALRGVRGRRFSGQIFLVFLSVCIPAVLYTLSHILSLVTGCARLNEIAQIYSLISLAIMYYAMRRYGLMNRMKDYRQDMFSNMMDMVLLLDEKACILRANRQAERLLGYSVRELIGMRIDLLFPDGAVGKVFEAKRTRSYTCRFPELQCLKKEGGALPFQVILSVNVDPLFRDVVCVMLIAHDISLTKQLEFEVGNYKKAQERISYLAYHDSLTGLANRKLLYERIGDQLDEAEQNDLSFAVIYIDLDNFKEINDRYGHDAGDFLLCAAAEQMKSVLRPCDVIARMGGDEFVVLASDLSEESEGPAIARKLQESLQISVKWNGTALAVEASVGIGCYPTDGVSVRALINKADQAMYASKRIRKDGRPVGQEGD